MSENMILCDDLQIIRVDNGIRLIPPHAIVDSSQEIYTIGSLRSLPISVYFLDLQGVTRYINDEGARVCGFTSAHQSLGKSLLDVTKQESAERLIGNCSAVIASDSIQIFEEENQRKDNVSLQFLSIKAPWYNDNNKIIGLMGCSIVVGQHSLSASLSIVRKLGLLDNNHNVHHVVPDVKINNVYLSARELQCLQFTVKGYTAKRIAKELGISHRTVEEYITNIRGKTGAATKAELIEMTLENYQLGSS
jgi:DNA-binding CsgD family transcriptional regulator